MMFELCFDAISFRDRTLVGEYAEEAVRELFERSGYVILPFGIERLFEGYPDITKRVRGSTPAQRSFVDFLRSFPDFVAIRKAAERDGYDEAFPIEVKFRCERTWVDGTTTVQLSTDMINRYKTYWPSTLLVMVCHTKRTVLAISVQNLQLNLDEMYYHRRGRGYFDLERCGFQPLWQLLHGHFSQVEVERVAADVIAWDREVKAERKRSARKTALGF
jgi:hypothetical protein